MSTLKRWNGSNWEAIGPTITYNHNDLVMVQDTQPTSIDNRIWVKPDDNDVEIPTMDEFDGLKSALERYNAYNLLSNIQKSDRTAHGVTWTWNGESVLVSTGSGSSTAIDNLTIYSGALPSYLEAGKTYPIKYSATNVRFNIYDQTSGSPVSIYGAYSDGELVIPDNCTSILIRLTVGANKTVNETVTPAILSTLTNKDLAQQIVEIDNTLSENNKAADAYATGNAIESVQAEFDVAMLTEDATINLLNPDTITTGYLLVNNVPTVNANYYYSDYIRIGKCKFIHSQGGSVSNQISCYDKDKTFIGIISYAVNVDHYDFVDNTDSNLRYVIITPLDGTVYVRVNGSLSRPKVVCPYFSPTAYGAKTFDLQYNQIFHKWGIKAAMFGDSITYGANGSESGQRVDKNGVWWVNALTHINADNLGVGSMGWVSTRFLPQIAFDKISNTDISDYDLITLCYGVNDNYATLGEWNTTDESTIMGQVNKCIKYIGATNPSARIIIIAPWNTPGSGVFPDWGYAPRRTGGFTRYELSEALKQAAEYYKIGFIGQEDCPLNGFGFGGVDNIPDGPYAGTDGVHPNPDGYNAMGHWLAAKISSLII